MRVLTPTDSRSRRWVSLYIYIHTYICIYMCMCVYVHIYRVNGSPQVNPR